MKKRKPYTVAYRLDKRTGNIRKIEVNKLTPRRVYRIRGVIQQRYTERHAWFPTELAAEQARFSLMPERYKPAPRVIDEAIYQDVLKLAKACGVHPERILKRMVDVAITAETAENVLDLLWARQEELPWPITRRRKHAQKATDPGAPGEERTLREDRPGH